MVPVDTAVEDLASRLRAAAASDAFSGVVVLRRGDERLLELALGPASRRWPVPNHLGTRFDTASITKTFTSVAVLQQVDAGRLDLDASIHDHVDLAGTTIPREVTLRHVLSHTSGIADDADEEAGEDYALLWVDKPCYSVMTTADFLPGFVHKEPNFAPGEGCRYCNVGYILAGLALEAVTGVTYRDYVREHVFARAGMTGAGFFDRRDPEPDVAEGWDPVRDDDGRIVSWRENIFSYPPIGSPDGGAQVRAEDLLIFLDAVRGGRLLSPELTAAFLTPQALHSTGDDGVSMHNAFGFELLLDPDGRTICWGKDGINAGASGIVRHYPTQGVDLVVLSNTEAGAWEPIDWAHDTIIALDAR